MNEAQQHHYFGSTGLFWATGSTRQEVIQKLAKRLSDNTNLLLAGAVKKSGGVYCWTCRVNAPEDANYGISNYAPRDVDWGNTLEFNITSKNGDVRLTTGTEDHLGGEG